MPGSIKTRIMNKVDSRENWESAQLSGKVLLNGELALVRDGSAVWLKSGDGSSPFAALPYVGTNTFVKNPDSPEYADGRMSDLSVIKLAEAEYAEAVAFGETQPNALYVVSADCMNAYDQRLRNLASGEDPSDAATVGQAREIADQAVSAQVFGAAMIIDGNCFG